MRRLALSLLCVVACGTSSAGPGPDAATVDTDAKPAGAADAADVDDDDVDASATAQTAVPTDKSAMFAYLQARTYQELSAESAVHTSAGPHGAAGVRTFINASLAASLAAGNDAHPVGAAAVKELHGSGGLSGWAVSVKIAADSGDGGGWYWYEVFSTTNGSNPIEGNGHPTCKGCHSGGEDFVLIPFPLQ